MMRVGDLWKHNEYALIMKIDRIESRRIYLSKIIHLSGVGFVDRCKMDISMFIKMFSNYYNFNDYYEMLTT